MSCRVPATSTGKALAKQQAALIELDISVEYFNPSLLKYKPRILEKTAAELSAIELFERYAQTIKREKLFTRNGYKKYTTLRSHPKACFGSMGLSPWAIAVHRYLYPPQKPRNLSPFLSSRPKTNTGYCQSAGL
jgi:hypothetical protein